MDDVYIREINKPALDDFAQAVNDEEAGGTAFVKSSVEWYDNTFTNLAVFRFLDPPGTLVAGPVQLLTHGQAAPAGAGKVWSGVVLVAGVNQAVTLYRSAAGGAP